MLEAPDGGRVLAVLGPPGNARRALGRVQGERGKREVCRVEGVTEVKNLRETRGGPMGVLPRAVVELRGQEVLDAAPDRVGVPVAGREQGYQRPGRLGGRRGPMPLGRRVVVREGQLAPAAVGVLVRADPGRGFLVAALAQVRAGMEQAAEREER